MIKISDVNTCIAAGAELTHCDMALPTTCIAAVKLTNDFSSSALQHATHTLTHTLPCGPHMTDIRHQTHITTHDTCD